MAADRDNLDRMTAQVLDRCSLHGQDDIRLDLEITRSAETTLHRIWNGKFLHDTSRDPRPMIPIVLDTDDEDDVLTAQCPSPTNPTSPKHRIVSQSTQDLFNDPFASDDSLPSPDRLLSDICSGSMKRKNPLPKQSYSNQDVILLDDEDDSPLPTATGRSQTLDYLKEWEDEMFGSQDADPQQSVLSSKEQKQREREERVLRRKQEQEEKKRAQEEKKRTREIQKAERAAEKELEKRREKANRQRTNRKGLLAEMIVEVNSDFLATPQGELLKTTLESKEAEVCEVTEARAYTISWRRKCNADWDGSSQQFVPYDNDNDIRIKDEDFCLVFLEMPALCDMIQNNTVDLFVAQIRTSCGDKQIMMMIEGAEAYYKKKITVQRRQFESIVRQSIQQDGSSDEASDANRRQRKKQRPNDMGLALTGPNKDKIEETLTYLQIVKDVMLVPTLNREDSADWITCLTTDLAHARYRATQSRGLGKARCGTDPQDTWVKMLEEIQLCTPAVSKAIVESYPNMQSLHRAYQRTPADDAQLLLAELEVERSSISARDRRVNSSMSKKIHTIITSDDDALVIA